MQIRIPQPVPEGLTVIETMRAEADGTIRLWPLHLDRLRRDCAAVGFPLDEDAVAARLMDRPGGGPLRLRLTVDASGQVEVTHQVLPPNPASWTVSVSDVILDSGNQWLRVKTSHRPDYDAARAGLPPDCNEALLINERGELCEGTITNLFLHKDGRLYTPALSCGLLPGILRQSLLEKGEAQEGILTPADLEEGQIFCGNALRGLVPARIV